MLHFVVDKVTQVFSKYSCLLLPVSFHQCTILIFIYMLPLSDEQTGKAVVPSKMQCSLGNQWGLARKVFLLIFVCKGLIVTVVEPHVLCPHS